MSNSPWVTADREGEAGAWWPAVGTLGTNTEEPLLVARPDKAPPPQPIRRGRKPAMASALLWEKET